MERQCSERDQKAQHGTSRSPRIRHCSLTPSRASRPTADRPTSSVGRSGRRLRSPLGAARVADVRTPPAGKVDPLCGMGTLAERRQLLRLWMPSRRVRHLAAAQETAAESVGVNRPSDHGRKRGRGSRTASPQCSGSPTELAQVPAHRGWRDRIVLLSRHRSRRATSSDPGRRGEGPSSRTSTVLPGCPVKAEVPEAACEARRAQADQVVLAERGRPRRPARRRPPPSTSSGSGTRPRAASRAGSRSRKRAAARSARLIWGGLPEDHRTASFSGDE